METDNIQMNKIIREAENFEKAGELGNALEYYSRALDVLVLAAKDYAEISEEGQISAVMGTGQISAQYMARFNDYLKKDKTAAVVSNRMGLVFARMENKASARAFFEQAIDLTPGYLEYNDPHIGLEMIDNLT
ncbi:MAG: hypothetical protein WA093_02880 [Minisyncoccales bacterium]